MDILSIQEHSSVTRFLHISGNPKPLVTYGINGETFNTPGNLIKESVYDYRLSLTELSFRKFCGYNVSIVIKGYGETELLRNMTLNIFCKCVL